MPSPILEGYSVLIVEDQMIIAMEAEAVLLSLGAQACRIGGSAEQALAFIDSEAVQFALLDINLGGTLTSEPVAARLRTLGVPFVVASGYGEAGAGEPSLKGAPVVTKPYTPDQLREAILTALDRPH